MSAILFAFVYLIIAGLLSYIIYLLLPAPQKQPVLKAKTFWERERVSKKKLPVQGEVLPPRMSSNGKLRFSRAQWIKMCN